MTRDTEVRRKIGVTRTLNEITNTNVTINTDVTRNTDMTRNTILFSKTGVWVSNDFGQRGPNWPQAYVIRRQRDMRGYLTIGIPSIKRPIKKPYLLNTLRYIMENTWEDERPQIVIIIFLADED
ncbi:unnamed protein product, partial [Owenia fusiformis]